jgi:hypothetical protein
MLKRFQGHIAVGMIRPLDHAIAYIIDINALIFIY